MAGYKLVTSKYTLLLPFGSANHQQWGLNEQTRLTSRQPQHRPHSHKEIVHLDYNLEALPPPPSDKWTRSVFISDTHTTSFDVPDGDGDVLLHSGDLRNTGTVEDFKKTMGWLGGLPHRLKMFGVIAFESPISISKPKPELSQEPRLNTLHATVRHRLRKMAPESRKAG